MPVWIENLNDREGLILVIVISLLLGLKLRRRLYRR